MVFQVWNKIKSLCEAQYINRENGFIMHVMRHMFK